MEFQLNIILLHTWYTHIHTYIYLYVIIQSKKHEKNSFVLTEIIHRQTQKNNKKADCVCSREGEKQLTKLTKQI